MFNVPKIREFDYSSLEYFWRENQDIERWVGWDDFSTLHPKIGDEWDRYKRAILAAELLFERYLDQLSENMIPEPELER